MIRLPVFCIFLLSMLIAGCNEPANHKSQSTKPEQIPPATGDRIQGQYIVTLKEATSVEILQEAFISYGIKSIKDLSKGRYLLTLEKDPGPEEISKQAATVSAIDHVQPNYIYRTMPQLHDDPQRPR